MHNDSATEVHEMVAFEIPVDERRRVEVSSIVSR